MNFHDYLDEFVTDWQLAGRATSTADMYCIQLRSLHEATQGAVDLRAVKRWLATSPSAQTARARGRAVRAFGTWAETNDGPAWTWWQNVPLSNVAISPQPTATVKDYETAMRRANTVRDRLAVELLWCTGMRVSELARVAGDDVALQERSVVVRQSKAGRPRLAPLSDRACRLIRRLPDGRDSHPLLSMTRGAIQQLLRRLDAPSPHAWRRGWAVRSLQQGVSETSVRAAAGWSSGAMVARYTAAASAELAIAEFARAGATTRR